MGGTHSPPLEISSPGENESLRAEGVEIHANKTAQKLFKHTESSKAISLSPSLALEE